MILHEYLGWVLASLVAGGMKPVVAMTLVEFLMAVVILAGISTLVWAAERYVQGHFKTVEGMVRKAAKLAMPTLAGLLCWVAVYAVQGTLPGHVLRGTGLLMALWLMERALRILPGPKPLKVVVGVLTCLVLLVLSVGNLRPILSLLDQTQVNLGGLTITVKPLLEGIFFLCLLSWLAVAGTSGLEYVLEKNSRFSPTLRTVVAKIFKFFAISLGVLIGLTVMGVNVTHLAFFGGALAIGIGWSLRPITSNLISGLFLLMDRSIKPGDVISLDDQTFGQVKALHSRYVVLRRRDGKEVLIPNEMMMNQPVINWSYTNKAVRSEVDIPVSYDSDMEQVQAVLKEAINGVPRVQSVPAPIVFIKEFTENGAVFIVRFWSVDPEMGVNNLKGDVNMACWKALKANGITVPMAQRVVHMAETTTLAKPKKRRA